MSIVDHLISLISLRMIRLHLPMFFILNSQDGEGQERILRRAVA